MQRGRLAQRSTQDCHSWRMSAAMDSHFLLCPACSRDGIRYAPYVAYGLISGCFLRHSGPMG